MGCGCDPVKDDDLPLGSVEGARDPVGLCVSSCTDKRVVSCYRQYIIFIKQCTLYNYNYNNYYYYKIKKT